MNKLRKVLRFLAPILVIALGLGVFVSLVRTRPVAERAPPTEHATPVGVVSVHAEDHAIRVRAQGVVIPARELVLQAELNGRVVFRHEDLVPGGTIPRGDTLVRIDPRDYRTAIAQQGATLESQRVQVQTEERRRAVAEREWELLARQTDSLAASPEGRALALREPQLRSASAAVDASSAQLAQARLTLTRTTLRAPFDALVREADVEVGQLVGPTARLATLVDTAHFWVQVSLPLESLAVIRAPGPDAQGAPVEVFQTIGEARIDRTGRVVRLLGDLDPVGRMARVLVEIDDPLGLTREDPGLPLLLGAYVHVEIEAGHVDQAIEIPRNALRDNDTVWVIEDDRLVIHSVNVVWRRPDTVLLGGITLDGAQVITTPLASPVEGMVLRVVGERGAPTVAASGEGLP